MIACKCCSQPLNINNEFVNRCYQCYYYIRYISVIPSQEPEKKEKRVHFERYLFEFYNQKYLLDIYYAGSYRKRKFSYKIFSVDLCKDTVSLLFDNYNLICREINYENIDYPISYDFAKKLISTKIKHLVLE